LATADFSVTLVYIYQTTRHIFTQDNHLHIHSRENIKFHILNRNLKPAMLTCRVESVHVSGFSCVITNVVWTLRN